MRDEGAPAAETGAFTPEALERAFAGRLGHTPSAAGRDFLAQALGDYAPDDLPDLTVDDFAALAAGIWTFCQAPDEAGPRVRLVPAAGAGERPLALDLLQIVQDDRPFLVDSVMGELVEQGVSIRAMLHPVVQRPGDGAHSVICVLLDPLDEAGAAKVVQGVRATLADVYAAVADFPAMLALMGRTLAELETTAPESPQKAESLALLRWLEADRFVFLGARTYAYPLTPTGRYAHEEPLFESEQSLGILRDPARGVLRRDNEPAVLSHQLRRMIEADDPLVVAKANTRSRVHRRAHMDYIGVKRYGPDRRPFGEVRFVGLFTAEAYDEPVGQVPLIRRKAAHVVEQSGAAPGSHDHRRLLGVLETYPRDELFQTSEADLAAIAMGVVHLYDRPRLRLFVRKDAFDRFVSVLLYVPKDRFDADLAERAGDILARAWDGRISALYPSFSDMPLARTHYIIGLHPNDHLQPDIAAVEAEIAEAARTWQDRFDEALRLQGDRLRAADIRARYAEAFPPAYRALFDANEALADLAAVETLSAAAPVQVRAYTLAKDAPEVFRFKLYRLGDAAPLSQVLPIVEHMGLSALVEHGFALFPAGEVQVWVHELVLRRESDTGLGLEAVKAAFEAAFVAAWSGRTESDGFNRLVLELGVSWREAALVRALARYRQQSGLDPSQTVQAAALADHPHIARLILDLFAARFDPAASGDAEARQSRARTLFDQIVEALQAVESLDADRALRRLALLVQAIVRTNYYQPGADGAPKPYISFKIASRDLVDLPNPKPYREIFVWSPEVEGVHLRFGPVARGGLRWSDRREDFRTEVLGLAKAQQVKNAVIVPVGAKGGFYPKRLPRGASAAAVREAAVAAYETFLAGLLDLTDNLDAQGAVVPPPAVIRLDGDDPYLVVAADKGTADFSDIANGVAESYGFWLGDAFASGGSAGYDHKAMAITARGAWEAVKRHFREMGKDIQAEPFTVIGVGDMSGDVFGNGMLLSKQIKLVAAFDHRHVFLDPEPDPARAWDERKRLFDLPRSSWADYDAGLISAGGGVFPRTAKSIGLTPQVRALLGIEDEALTPADLIRAILKAPAELLYLGGIGTYIKASQQSHADVGDKANDAVRVDATDLRVKVVGEGANLGVTQAGRIAYARAGGRIDTDAIDNSAGVDTSDHEVNIKILTSALERSGRMDRAARDALLQSMTDEIAQHVLAHNHDQTLALSMMERTAVADLGGHARFMAELVAAGRLDRQVEGLPGPAAIAELAKTGRGLTRPELAVLLAYGKLELSAEIVASPAPDDPHFQAALEAYFPAGLRQYGEEIRRHRLRREIVATGLSNAIVDVAGPAFAQRLKAATGCDTRALVTAFEAAWRIFRLDEAWAAIGALDGKAPAAGQLALYLEAALVLRRQVFWLARRNVKGEVTVEGLIEAYRPAADALRAEGPDLLSPLERAAVQRRIDAFVRAGAPQDLAAAVGALRPLTATSDVADLARAAGWNVLAAGRIFHQAGAAFGFDRLRAAAGAAEAADYYERQAMRRLIEDLATEQAAVARAIMAAAPRDTGAGAQDDAAGAVEAWATKRAALVEAVRQPMAEIEASGDGWSFAKLTIVNGALRELAGAG